MISHNSRKLALCQSEKVVPTGCPQCGSRPTFREFIGKYLFFDILGNALCLLHLDLFRDGFEHIASFDDEIRMGKKLRLSFRHLSIRASLRHSAFHIGHFSQLRLDAIQVLIPRVLACELDSTCAEGGIVLVERTVELAHKAPLVLGQVQQRTVNQDLTDGRGNNALALLSYS